MCALGTPQAAIHMCSCFMGHRTYVHTLSRSRANPWAAPDHLHVTKLVTSVVPAGFLPVRALRAASAFRRCTFVKLMACWNSWECHL